MRSRVFIPLESVLIFSAKRRRGMGSLTGFTLIEIMIALAVTGGLLITLIYSINYHLSIIERHETITIASLLAREKIKGRLSEKGTFPPPYEDYSYEVVLRETLFAGVSEVLVIVRRGKEEVMFSELIQR